MNDNARFDREEISQILKLASELDQGEVPITDEGLTQSELEKVAEDVGIDPRHIKTAIQHLKEQEYTEDDPAFFEESFTFRKTLLVDGEIDDELWEDIVTEIRRINGGIGKTGKIGSTYEWEQRKQNTGYLQVAVTPKKEYIRLRISSSYRSYSRMMGMIGGIIGFVLTAILSKGLSFAQGFELMFAAGGGLGGWGLSRFYLKSWMRNKRDQLRTLAAQLKSLISSRGHAPEVAEPEVTIDSSEHTQKSDEHSPPKRERGQNH